MIYNYQGISENRIAPVVAKLSENISGQILVITASDNKARRIATDLSFFACNIPVITMPDLDPVVFKYEVKSREVLNRKLAALSQISSCKKLITVVPVLAALEKLPDPDLFKKDALKLSSGGEIEREDLIAALVNMGYERSFAAEAAGQFSVRGDIVDVFCPGRDEPVRIEFFDTEIDSIRSYDPLTQRSVENLESIAVWPCVLGREGLKSSLCAYLPDDSIIVIDDPSRQNESVDFYLKENSMNPEALDAILAEESLYSDDRELYICTPFAQKIRHVDRLKEIKSFVTKQAPVFSGHMDILESELKSYVKNGYQVTIACSSEERLQNLKDFLGRSGLDEKVVLRNGTLSQGTEFADEKQLFLSEQEIFHASKERRKKKAKKGREIKAFTDIKKGDYVVHEAHGVGRFVGVEKLTVQGSVRDYLKIRYAGEDVLYVPVDQMESIQKYVGSEGIEPRITGLSGDNWQKTKERARAAIRDMAADFLKLAAQRAEAPGFAFGQDSAWQKEFEDSFPYEETDDQLRCSEEIKKDMEQGKAMDRLLCGDVGYGKTEVAARAIFKCLEQGKQAAVLVPTTILANQHFHTFKDRFQGYPFSMEMLSRFRTPGQQDKIINDLKKGDVDLVVGTHRLLSSDVEFKDLGLLVIDEEQRFGVEHKDAIKKLRTNVDVLTLSATPIPRTLHMSLIGVRDMSVIEEPPEDRYPVQTYVMEQDDSVLTDSIRREMGRGGQVYVVYNRVNGIQAVARKIHELVPEARIAVGHGRMGERELEDIMYDFVNHDYDILIATTIIESGLDIPNVNTLIVLEADKYGLSQLYQLRGRVGRSSRMAYAYLMYRKDKVLTEIAEKRLRAIREFTEFGSGFRVAMRDLELRGAGNLLGVEQSGHMLSIGYELYCKLVEEAVRELKGEPVEDLPISSDTSVELAIPAYLPEEYVSDEITRLDLYKRISVIQDEQDRLDMEDELMDRFGDIPAEGENLLDIALIRNMASRCGISSLVLQQDKLVLLFEENNILKPEIFAALLDRFGNALTIYAGVEPRISLAIGRLSPRKKALEILNILLGT